jgi:predicted MPP superfamily phosphohydrolase
LINEKNPDLVLIAGDLIDFSVIPLTEQNMAEEFYKIKAPIYACMGNHEYISGEEKAKEFFKKAGIRLLQDEALLLQKYGLLIVGRDDRFNKSRKTLPQLIEGYETDSLYTIVLDHQPYHLEEAEKSGIDLQLSGHTHDGQVWPLNYITSMMYENSHGYSQRRKTHYYVSSGIGIWGGKFRIGTRSEYVVITIE